MEQPADSVTYQQFYDALSPYGHWIDYPGFGYAWSPDVADFSPYVTNGFWVNTNLGGAGTVTTIGAGHLFITVAGFMKLVMDGYGNPVMNGHLHG